MPLPRVIISGGGTGGHIFPAIAIANELKKKVEGIEILFVGAVGRMEMEKVPQAGYKIEGLWISGFQRKLSLKNLTFPLKVVSSLIKAQSIVSKFKPDVVVGVGGYASGPLLQIATGRKIPSLIQEQNSFPGVTNRLLAKKVNSICVAYSGMERWFPKDKIIITGNPVRQEVVNLQGKHPRGLEYFGLQADKPVVLVVGGSLGARTINQSIKKILPMFAENNIQLIWQTGKLFAEEAAQAVKEINNPGIKTMEFIKRMDLAYALADLVVSRAGAMSVSELCMVGKAVILIPSPNVAEDHQTKNAMALVNNAAAVLVTDGEAKEKLEGKVLELINDKAKREQLSNNILKLAYNNSAETIAGEVLKLAQRK